jgi:uncharacterized protein YndB with AHSA1/START domain
MPGTTFVYTVYIRTTPEKLWDALIAPEFTRQYWCETHQESTWTKGAEWKMLAPDGRVCDAGQVLEIDKPRKLVVSWRHELSEEVRAEGHSRATFEIEPAADAMKLTVTHEIDVPNSKLIQGVSGGWPPILSSLKSLLETGQALELTAKWPEGM